MAYRDSQKTREKIIKATQELFASRGYYNTSTSEIASKAGVAEGTIFKHFKTKTNLLFALVDEIDTKGINNLLKQATEDATEDATGLALN